MFLGPFEEAAWVKFFNEFDTCTSKESESQVLAKAGSDRTGPDQIGTGRVGSGRVGSSRVGSGRVGSDRTASDRIGSDRIDKTRTGSITKSAEERRNTILCLSLLCSRLLIYWDPSKCFFSRGDYRFRSGIMKDTMWRIVVNTQIDCVRNGLLLQTWKLTTIFYFTPVPDNCTIAWFSNRKRMSVDERRARRIVGILL